MTRNLSLRRFVGLASLFLTFLTITAPKAMATHLRGVTITWQPTSTPGTVKFTFQYSQRWSYPGTPGVCAGAPTCPALNSAIDLISASGTGRFDFGDGHVVTAAGSIPGTVTSINQAEDWFFGTFTFTHQYTSNCSISSGPFTAFFYATNRISTLELGHDEPEYISTTVNPCATNGAPVASMPAVLAVPLLSTTGFDLGAAVSDIDPTVTLHFQLSTFAQMFGPSSVSGISSIACPSGITYTLNGGNQPPGFSISGTGQVTWDTTKIQPAITSGNCGFAAPKAGDLWTTQVIVQAIDKVTGAVKSTTPIDIIMKFVNAVGVLPTLTLNPVGPQTVQVGAPVTFTATGNSANTGAKITLNASGVPVGATASNLNQTLTPPVTSTFNWTPTSSQTGTFVVTYTATDDNFQQVTKSETIIVATPPTVTCPPPLTVQYNQAGKLTATVFDPNNELLSVTWALDSLANVVQTDSGVVAYPSPGAQVSLNQPYGSVGPHTVTITATDPHGVSASCDASVSVTKADQTINFAALSDQTYGAADFNVSATATSNLTVSFAAAGNCSVSGNTVHITGAGSCTITASQPGDLDYNAAPDVMRSFNINTAQLTVTAGSYSGVYDGSSHALSACSVSANIDGLTCTNSPVGPVGADVGSGTVTSVLSGSATNYSVTTNNGSWSITPLTVHLTGGNYSGVYDGSAHSPTACISSYPTGVICSNSLTSVGPNVGSGSVSPVQSIIGNPSDFTIAPTNGSWSITPLTVHLAGGNYSGVYDGIAHSPSACVSSYAGVTCNNNPASVGPDVGGAAIAPVAAMGTGIAADYTISPTSGSWSITPLTVNLTGGSYTGVYDGSAHSPTVCVSSYPTGVSCSNNPTSVGPNVGSGMVSPVQSIIGNPADFTVSSHNGTYSITQALVTATAGSYSGLYDTFAHAPTLCVVSGMYKVGLSCTNSPSSVGPGAGSGIITPAVSGLTSNFSLTSVNGAWSITKPVLTITTTGSSQYSDPLGPSYSVTGFKPGDTQASACTGILSPSTPATSGSAPGQFTATTNYSGFNCPNYTLTSGSGSYIVSQEDSTLTYTGLQYFGVPATQTAVSVTLAYTLQDASVVQNPVAGYYDASPGDITKAVAAPISITGAYVSSSGSMANFTGSCNPTAVIAASGLTLSGSLVGYNPVPSTGTFTCTISLPVNGTFTATAAAGTGSYYMFSGGDTQVSISTSNGGVGLITGGGYQTGTYLVTNGNGTNGKYADSSPVMLIPAVGTKMNYGFVAKFNKNASNLQGNVNIIIRSRCLAAGVGGSSYVPRPGLDGLCVYQVKATNISSMADQPGTSTLPGYGNIVGNAIISDVTWSTVQSLLGGGAVQMEMYDSQSGNSGTTPDTLGIQVTDNKGKLWFSNNLNGSTLKTVTTTVAPQIQGGNITVH